LGAVKITEGVYFVGALDRERKMFDEVIPLPDGTSYNSYLIQGNEKTALIDAVDPDAIKQLFENLNTLKVKKIDYIIANHAEQDHSGGIPFLLEKYPEAQVVTNEKCAGILKELLLIPENKFIIIKEGQEISLGNKTLAFILLPWVHWPETQATFYKEEKILFTCDFFGAHIATGDIFNDKNNEEPAKRYYAEIMSPFRNNVTGNIKKVEALNPAIIAPSHGIVHLNPSKIIAYYKEWASDKIKNEVVLVYVSMHHSVKKMASHLHDALVKRGVAVSFFDLAKADVGKLAMSLVDAATIVVGAPNFLAGAHPAAASAVFLANALRPKLKFASLLISYSWAEKASEQLKAMLTNFKGELIAPVIIKGYPKEKDLKQIEALADEIAGKHKEIGLM